MDPDVVVLGAGFSRAVSGSMPLTDELGNLAFARAGLETMDWWAAGWTFESWLSRLAEDQPDLDESENLVNRSLFARLTNAVAEVITDRQQVACDAGLPEWLGRLVALWHVRRTTVITFNWDTLVESAVEAHALTVGCGQPEVRGGDIVEYLPPAPSTPWGVEPLETFRLVKLHGSIDWWWTPGDTTAATLTRWSPDRSGRVSEDDRRRHVPGRSAFIVPPTSAKSSYYRNPFTRELWRQAGQALSQAKNVALIGYSLPLTDLVAVGMIRHWTRNDVHFTVVNVSGAAVMQSLMLMAYEPHQVERIDGDGCVASFVNRFESTVAHSVLDRLRRGDIGAAVCVAWSWGMAAAVTGARVDGGRLVLSAEEPASTYQAFRSRTDRDPTPITIAELLSVIDGADDVERVDVEFPNSTMSAIVDVSPSFSDTGFSRVWAALMPSTFPPSLDRKLDS
jgi:hypothetical protein